MKSRALQVVFGVLILLLALVALNALGSALSAESIFGQYWPVILIVMGVIMVGADSKHVGMPLGLIGVGIILLLDRTGVLAHNRSLEAILFALVGILVIALVFTPSGSKKTNTSTHDREIE